MTVKPGTPYPDPPEDDEHPEEDDENLRPAERVPNPENLDAIRKIRDESILPVARKIVESGTEARPMLHILMKDDTLAIAALVWDSPEDKTAMCRHLATLLRRDGAKAIAFVSEVWTVTVEKDKPAPVPGSLRHDPRRQEALCVFIATRDGEREVQIWSIIRDPAGVQWGPVQTIRDANVEPGLWEGFWSTTDLH